MSNWSRVVNTTTRKFIRQVEVNILKNRKILALLKDRGRITFGHSGTKMDWKVEYNRNVLSGYTDGDPLVFDKKDRWKTAELGWRGYSMTDAMSKMEREQNKGNEAIIKVYSTIATNLAKDIEELFGDEVYNNGYLAINEKRFHGIESVFGEGATFDVANKILQSDQSYASLSTKLGTYGGAWNGSWPDGLGDYRYDFWSPIIVNYGSTGFTPATNNDWVHSGHAAIRYLIMKTARSKSATGQLDVILLENELYRLFLEQLDTKERIVIDRNAARSGLVKLGFADTVNIDGTDVSWEYSIPTGVGYGFNMMAMELCSLQEQLFEPDGPDYDIANRTWRFAIDCLGNFKLNPKFLGKLKSKLT